jgi:6-pyruvoyltetrahydropterin/6-carboxytetrahydropterin synthase
MPYRLTLAKQDFKFSAAHFTLFGPDEAEPLHGHNYRVVVELEADALDGEGLVTAIGAAKERIRAACRRLDDRVLLPEGSPYLRIEERDGSCQVLYARRTYQFPAAEVLRLPIANTSIELLALHLWHELAPRFAGTPARSLAVTVDESDGQSARYEAAIDP